ncbi:MAG: hypothetical protein WCT48_03225 [Candidatus Paceibacterota bacterium]
MWKSAGTSALFVEKIEISKNSLTQVSLAVVVSFIIFALSFLSFDSEARMITQTEGLLLLTLGFFYWFYLYKITDIDAERLEDENIADNQLSWVRSIFHLFGVMFLGLIALLFGSDIVTKNAILLAQSFGVSEFIIAGTIIAVGTTLPELVTSIQAVRQKQFDLMIGNIVGSIIVNTLFILGISGVIRPLAIVQESISYLYMNSIASILLLVGFTLFIPREFKRWQSMMLFATLAIFLIFVFNF